MAGIQLSGLISGSFDWKSVVDQLIQIDSAPIARLQTEQAKNIDRLASLSGIQTQLSALQTSAKALTQDGLFSGRTAKSSNASSTWSMAAANSAPSGSYAISVTQLATASKLKGAVGISEGISETNDVSGVTLATIPTSTAVSAGVFTVNGKQVSVALTDSLQDVFDKISTATAGGVTASYDSASDKVTLLSNSATEVVLGASNDTSNFLAALRLANNGTASATSSSSLGSASLSVPLASSRLKGSLGSVDAAGNGEFSINGVSIAYNINTDSISAVLSKISSSSAGVTASYDRGSDRVVLSNKATGDSGVGVSDTTGGLLNALGVIGGTLQHGSNALFSVNGGSTLSSTSNTLSASEHGITGLTVTVNSADIQTINVAPSTGSMNSAIQDFISKFNAVQSFIERETKITKTPDGKVSAALLADNREVQVWASELRSLAFKQVSGLTGTVQRLESLGIDFSTADSIIRVKDQAKLDSALSNNSADVQAFFGNSVAGFATQFDSYLGSKLKPTSGALATQMGTLNKQNSGIDVQIATLNARLANQRELLTASFLAMQNAQSAAQQQQQQLTNMFGQKKDS